MVTASDQSQQRVPFDMDGYLNGYTVAIVEYENWEPQLNDIPPIFQVVETVAEGLDYATADAIAIAKSYDLLQKGDRSHWAVMLPPGSAV